MATERTTLVVDDVRMLTPTVRHLSLVRADGQPPSFVAGQFLMVHFEHEGTELKRSYSIASQPLPETRTWDIAVSFVEDGRGTRFLFGLSPGDRVEATLPLGRFSLRAGEKPGRLFLVGTGTGVVPYRSMLPELETRTRTGMQIVVLQGVRTPDDVLYADDFREAALRAPGLTFEVCFSRVQRPAPEPGEFTGYVQERLDAHGPDPEKDLIYLCGNPAMIDDALDLLKKREFPTRSIRREKYVSP